MAAHQAPLSLGFSRQEYWSGLPFPSSMHACMLSHFTHVWICVMLRTAARQAPPSTGFCRKNTGVRCHFLLHSLILEILLLSIVSQPSLPSPPLETVYSSAFSEMSYKWIHLACSLLNMTYFTYQNALRFIYVIAVINSSFFFLMI